MEIYAQIIWNTLTVSALIALMALPLNLIYATTRVLHVANGGAVLAAGYLFYFGWSHGFGWLGAGVFAVLGGVALGLIINEFVYEILRKRRVLTGTAGMLSSVAVLIILQNVILALWTSRTIVLHTPLEQINSLTLDSVIISPISLIILFVCATLFVLTFLLLRFTKTGRAMRAVADHEEMAEVVGVDAKRVRMLSIAWCSGVGAVAGILAALFYNLQPPYAVGFAIDSFSTAIVGGIGSLGGTLIASFVYNLLSNLGGYWWTAGIKTLFAFVAVFLFLLLRPQGIFGKKRR